LAPPCSRFSIHSAFTHQTTMTTMMTGSTGAIDITDDVPAASLKAQPIDDESSGALQSYIQTRNRRASDACSGLTLKREEWPDYTDDELVRQFEMFQHYDLDSTGFISAENLFEVLQAMDVADVSMEMVASIIDEVAVLTGHDNDGKLSFRDYMHAIRQDRIAAEHNEALDAADEKRRSLVEVAGAVVEAAVETAVPLEPEEEAAVVAPAVEEEPASPSGAAPAEEAKAEEEEELKVVEEVSKPAAAAEEAAPARARRGSMSALNALAASRIKAFQQVVSDASTAQKLAAFKNKPVEMSGPMVNSDEMHKETLRNKVKAFEVAATFKGKVELKKTWKKVGGQHENGGSNYHAGQKIYLGGQPAGVAPKKKLSELP